MTQEELVCCVIVAVILHYLGRKYVAMKYFSFLIWRLLHFSWDSMVMSSIYQKIEINDKFIIIWRRLCYFDDIIMICFKLDIAIVIGHCTMFHCIYKWKNIYCLNKISNIWLKGIYFLVSMITCCHLPILCNIITHDKKQ